MPLKAGAGAHGLARALGILTAEGKRACHRRARTGTQGRDLTLGLALD